MQGLPRSFYAYDRDAWEDDNNPGRSPYRLMPGLQTSGFLGLESKFWDTSFSRSVLPVNAASPSNGNLGCISTVGQGDGPELRKGHQFTITRVELHCYVEVLPTAAMAAPVTGSDVYVALVLDTQTNGAQCLSQDVFKNILGSETGAGEYCQTCLHMNLLNEPRFRVLRDYHLSFPPQPLCWNGATYGLNGDNRTFQLDFDCNIRVHCTSGTTPSIANIVDNSLHVMAFAFTAGEGVAVAFNSRIRFVG